MNSLKSIVAALVAGTTLAISVPAMAQSGDSATIQTNTQTNVVTGNRNNVRNSNSQTSTTIRNRRNTSGDTGTVQGNDQYNDVAGNRNNVGNTNSQTNTDIRNNGTVRIRR
ncbi:MAG: hypothetical protein WCP16_03520 [Pseudanabaena sp. ELA645]|jgi:hypothetical protein